MASEPAWWRGEKPAAEPRGSALDEVQRGEFSEFAVAPVVAGIGLREVNVFDARVTGADLALTDLHLKVEWSEFNDCRFHQKARPVLNEYGIAAQGSFGNSPAIFRNCTFEGVRFKLLGGFSMSRATFEDCTFVNCRWEGHFANDAWLINNRFIGKMNGCVWFGAGDVGRNVIAGNNFSETIFTTNVAFRNAFPVDDQTWPDGYEPLEDD